MTAQAHATAVLSLLTGAGITVHDGAVPANPTYPYAVLWTSPGDADTTNLDYTSDVAAYDLQVTSVGATAASARITADKVRTALLDVAPTITGRTCWPIRSAATQPVREDRDVTIPGTASHPMYAVQVFQLTSIPA